MERSSSKGRRGGGRPADASEFGLLCLHYYYSLWVVRDTQRADRLRVAMELIELLAT
jgi:hypothetical protein